MVSLGDIVRAQQRPVIGRHHHDHRRPFRLGAAAALNRDARAEMAAGHDDGNAAVDMLEAGRLQKRPFLVGEQELFGIVGEDAESIDTLVDHAIESAALTPQVKRAVFVEGGRNDRKDSAIGCVHRHVSGVGH